MRRLATAVTVCVALGVPLLPVAVLAGGRSAAQHVPSAHGGAPAHGLRAHPDFRPTGAFGSPGGFPFVARRGHQGPPGRTPPGYFVRRLPRHTVAPWFPVRIFLYTPTAPYGPSVDTPSSPVISVSPVIYASPTVYVAPPIGSSEPVPVAAAPATPVPLPSVVEHPTGRYELRGDGVTTPYVWVWIPSPPAAPPSPDEPPAGPALSRRSTTYRWTDDEGTTFWTNRIEKIPERYRSRAPGAAHVVERP